MIKEEGLPILAGGFVAIVFGFSFLFTKEALSSITAFHLLGFRFAFAVIILTLLRVLGIIKINFKGKKLNTLLLLAFFQPVTYFICETLGIKMTSSSEAGMMIALIPVFVTILAAIFLNERPSKKQLVFILISVIGVLFIILMKGSLEVSGQLTGIFILLGAVISAGIFNILSRKSSLQFKPLEITYIMMWIGAIFFNIVALTQHYIQGNLVNYFQPLGDTSILIAILYLGGLSSVIAFFLLNFMLSKIEASRSAVFTNLTTIISIIGGVVFRNEPFYWFHIIGGIMILLGVWGTNYYGNYEPKEVVPKG
ncbi:MULTISPECIES: DMT family transporter [unclassified Candidatus Frackibacter]|uniref:DMT family transporter n=1 Tax=unclassified Candidatus Frackibacter TaxID=2648818 RepID=UPI00087EF655|nr:MULTISPECIES: DMT family transporter [unclassified Candidatus Frackibacter]SDC01482.1 Permease of the drug/metabolite transporter (DMT) superfamily [Candidatus Frackibacter sp. WG11]SEM32705.1 Permease of the drug/metabolite transporter (DMT) superfamily [Candidatus Frackibacter sp. WG12]SFL37677.1 Permease of the drug/metabolite transporter (DMT) superfamily [Candidatus Frackibacter sp. WG13]